MTDPFNHYPADHLAALVDHLLVVSNVPADLRFLVCGNLQPVSKVTLNRVYMRLFPVANRIRGRMQGGRS